MDEIYIWLIKKIIKTQVTITKKNSMTKKYKSKFNLEERTTEFAINIVTLCKKLPKNCLNRRPIEQLIGSSGSIGANYREANDSLGKKDFIHRLKISRKEAKEAIHWLRIIKEINQNNNNEINKLIDECQQLKNILSAIIIKSE